MSILTYCEPWEETLGKPHSTCYKALSTLQERLSSSTEGKISLDFVLAWTLVIGWLYVGAQGEVCAIVVQVVAPLTIWLLDHSYLRHRRHVSSFYPALAAASLILLFAVFELEVVPFMEILPHENLLFLAMAFTAAWLAFSIRRGVTSHSGDLHSGYCKTCETLVAGRDHHSVWLGVCVGDNTRRKYSTMLLLLLAACVYGANLTLTTVCRPRVVLSMLLLPDSCPEVFEDVHMSLCFISAIFALEICAVCILLLLALVYRALCHGSASLRHNH